VRASSQYPAKSRTHRLTTAPSAPVATCGRRLATADRRTRGGWNDPQIAFRIFEKAQELGINLIGVHKGVPLGPQPIEHTQT
jgi:hypothetical protein